MTCAVCAALEFGSDDSLRALVVYQARALDRLTGGRYEQPTPEQLTAGEVIAPKPCPSILEAVQAALSSEAIFRKPGRVAAPRLVEQLAEAGIHLTQEAT